jgi:hypothetical protein
VASFGIFLNFNNSKAATTTVTNQLNTSTSVSGGTEEAPVVVIDTSTSNTGGGYIAPTSSPVSTSTPPSVPATPTNPPSNPEINNNPTPTPAPTPEVPVITKNGYKLSIWVPEQYKVISPGQEFFVSVDVKSNTLLKKGIPITINYQIENNDNEVVITAQDNLYIKGELLIKKPIVTYSNLEAGVYTVKVTTSLTGDAVAYDTFQIKGIPALYIGGGTSINQTALFQALFFLLLFFLLVAYFEYHKVAIISAFIKKVDENDLKQFKLT